MQIKSKFFFLVLTFSLLKSYGSFGQIYKDTSAFLTRFVEDQTTFYRIPLTKYCFIKQAGLKRDWPNGWIMKWDVINKPTSNLLFLEMNSTDVEDWVGNQSVSGSVQLIFELPSFNDSIILKNLTYKTKGLNIINNYDGGKSKKKYLYGELKLWKIKERVFISSLINLITEKPKTKQQFVLDSNMIPSLSFEQYQELTNQIDSTRQAKVDIMVEDLVETVSVRDSLLEIEDSRIKDSLRHNPYKGSFRFWISKLNKGVYSRVTYAINNDSLLIKKGPYDFIYLAKNYPIDSIYFSKKLNKNEKVLLTNIENRIEVDSLEDSYDNLCIINGLIISFSFESAKFSKEVTVSNYYNETIAYVIGQVNKIVPKKYRIFYDKKILLKMQLQCDKTLNEN